VVFITIVSLSTLYQFWIHTETIDTLGPLEWVLNTPSHHRVHHATNAQYLDKNYAATLIIWDRLFGTFEREVDQPIYGTVKPMDSFNPLWAYVWYLVVLLKTAAKAPRWADKLQIWFRGPAWRPAELGPSPYTSPVVPEDQVKYDPPAARPLQAYLLMQFLPTAAALTGMLFAANTAPISLLASLTLLILMTTWVWGGLLEYQPWALAAELTRLASLTLLVFVFSPDPVLRMLAFAFAVGSAGWLIAARRAPMPA
jgi:sterol desaturase/sphingolipid hydroxylase (fatty acid hydroxylase superfamily)